MQPRPYLTIYRQLFDAYGPQQWWPADSAFEMMCGVVLVQNTAWTGAYKAVQALWAADLGHPAAIRAAGEEALWPVIRPAGFFRVKAKRLMALCEFLADYEDDPEVLFQTPHEELRKKLLGVYGLGKESVDSILCYGAGAPWFVVDAYTKRLFTRTGLLTEAEASYDRMQQMVHEEVPANTQDYNEYHALIVRHAKEHCRARKPLCDGCPVTPCDYGNALDG